MIGQSYVLSSFVLPEKTAIAYLARGEDRACIYKSMNCKLYTISSRSIVLFKNGDQSVCLSILQHAVLMTLKTKQKTRPIEMVAQFEVSQVPQDIQNFSPRNRGSDL